MYMSADAGVPELELSHQNESHGYIFSDQLMFKLNINGKKIKYHYHKDEDLVKYDQSSIVWTKDETYLTPQYTLFNQFNNEDTTNIIIEERSSHAMRFLVNDIILVYCIPEKDIDFSIFLSNYSFFLEVAVIQLHWNTKDERGVWFLDQMDGRQSVDFNSGHCSLSYKEFQEIVEKCKTNYSFLNDMINQRNKRYLLKRLEEHEYTNNSNDISKYFDIRNDKCRVTYYPNEDCKIRYTCNNSCILYSTYKNKEYYIEIQMKDYITIRFSKLLHTCPPISVKNTHIDLTSLLTNESVFYSIKKKISDGNFNESLFYNTSVNNNILNNLHQNSSLHNSMASSDTKPKSKPKKSVSCQTDGLMYIPHSIEQIQPPKEENQKILSDSLLMEEQIVEKHKKKLNQSEKIRRNISGNQSNKTAHVVLKESHHNTSSDTSDNWLFVIIIFILLVMYYIKNYNNNDIKEQNNV